MKDKSTKLFLFTNVYPFGTDEVFVENEVKVLASYFNEIHIYPSKKESTIREYPQNVTIHFFSDQLFYNTNLKLLLTNFYLFIKILLGDLKSNGLFVFFKYLRKNTSTISKAIVTADYLTKNLNANTSPKNIYYSYWMNDWALTCAILKYKKIISKFIFRVHGYDLYDYLRPDKYIPFKHFNMEMCDHVYTVCKAAQNYLKGLNIFPEKVKLCQLGVFDRGINPFPENDKFIIVSCSSLNIYKRVDKIIDVLKLIKFPVKWIHFGGKGDWLSVEEFESRCQLLPANIEYEFKGPVSNDVLLNFYQKNIVHLFIHLTFTEGGVPVVLQEAASFGIPMLASNTGGVPEIVNEETGILIEKDFEIENVVALIIDFKSSRKNSLEFRNNVKLFWENNFKAETNFKKFYNEIA